MKKALAFICIILLLLTACKENVIDEAAMSNSVNNNVYNDVHNDIHDGVHNGVYKSELKHDNISIPDLQDTEEPLKEVSVEKNMGDNQLEEDKDKLLTDKEFVLKTFESKIPEDIVMNMKYDKYEVPTNYLLVLSSKINIREKPSTSSKVIGNAHYFEKVNLVAEVQGEFVPKFKTDRWYKIAWKVEKQVQNGYIQANLAEHRGFQFDKMLEAVKRAKNEIDNNTCAYITNYKNRVGTAPLYNGSTKDKFGILRNQSAPAYYEPNLGAEFRYISDGTLVSILAETDSFYKVSTLSFNGEYYIPKKYISFKEKIEKLTKVVVVDRKNQNEGVFELINGKWNLISYIYATTGENSKHKLPTDLGYYMAIQKVAKFSYLDDVTKQIAGYAPYAIRFNGGAYIHGIPVDYALKDGKRVDPGLQEYLITVGTVPRSHKCVRNYTSHSKFLYDWIEIGKSTIIVIE